MLKRGKYGVFVSEKIFGEQEIFDAATNVDQHKARKIAGQMAEGVEVTKYNEQEDFIEIEGKVNNILVIIAVYDQNEMDKPGSIQL